MLAIALSYWPIVLAYGVWVPVIGGALAVAYFVPFLRTPALITAGSVVAGLVCFQLGDNTGAARIQKQLDAALVREFEQGEAARSDAERTVPRDDPASVRDDPWNRDNWKE